jgi:TPR repeat
LPTAFYGVAIRCFTETAPIVAVQLPDGVHVPTTKLFSHGKVSLSANCMTASNCSRKEELPKQQSLGNYVLIIVVSAAMGAGVTWLIMSQRSTPQFDTVHPPPPTAFSGTPAVSALAPGDATVGLGNFAYDQQRWSEAIRQYRQAIADGADNPDVRTDLGNAFRFSGQPQQALDQYTIAAEIKSAAREQFIQRNQPFHRSAERTNARNSAMRRIHAAISVEQQIACGSTTAGSCQTGAPMIILLASIFTCRVV